MAYVKVLRSPAALAAVCCVLGKTSFVSGGSECAPLGQRNGDGTGGVNLLQHSNTVHSRLSTNVSTATRGRSYRLCRGTYNVGGYTCQSPMDQDDTKIFFPCNQKTSGALPVVAYAHGMGGRGEIDAAADAFEQVVALGIVVIVPYTDGYVPGRCTSKTEYKDVLRVLHVSEKSPSFHKALRRVDWSKQAVWGYSMGGKTAPLAVTNFPDNRVKALVASHGARECAGIEVPSLLLTGTGDTASSPPEVMQREFNSIHAQEKVFLNLQGAYHDEPLAAGRSNMWVGKFLACHLGLQDTCKSIYGASREICNAQMYAPNGCIVVQGSSPTSPSPVTTPPTPIECTTEGDDPWSTGTKIDCCGSLVDCLGDHSSNGRWFYKCLATC